MILAELAEVLWVDIWWSQIPRFMQQLADMPSDSLQ